MNQQYLFNVKYYENLTNSSVSTGYEEINRQLIEAVFEPGTEEMELCNQTLAFKVLYPGLLVGTGYNHEAGAVSGNNNDEIKTGFSLDYVSGLPFIPGSTVKGVLRSAFHNHTAFIADLLSCNEKIVAELELAVFEHGKDVFLDSFPVKGDKDGKLLGFEYITPHKANDPRYDGLTGINPIRMLKIRSGVTILFRFLLGETVVELESRQYKISATTKLALFGYLLENYGIGAKTNTGVGRLGKGNAEVGYKWLKQKSGGVFRERGNAAQLNALEKSLSDRKAATAGKPFINRAFKNDDVLGECPICHGKIIVGYNGKPHHDSNCSLRYKRYFKIELDNEQLRKLLSGQEFTVYDERAGYNVSVKADGTEEFMDRNGNHLHRFRFKKVRRMH